MTTFIGDWQTKNMPVLDSQSFVVGEFTCNFSKEKKSEMWVASPLVKVFASNETQVSLFDSRKRIIGFKFILTNALIFLL